MPGMDDYTVPNPKPHGTFCNCDECAAWFDRDIPDGRCMRCRRAFDDHKTNAAGVMHCLRKVAG